MNCMALSCKAAPKKAEVGFSYMRKGRGKYFHACAGCAETFKEKLTAQSIAFQTGPLCPFCSGTGTNRAFLHVQQGHCFRCDGKGHW